MTPNGEKEAIKATTADTKANNARDCEKAPSEGTSAKKSAQMGDLAEQKDGHAPKGEGAQELSDLAEAKDEPIDQWGTNSSPRQWFGFDLPFRHQLPKAKDPITRSYELLGRHDARTIYGPNARSQQENRADANELHAQQEIGRDSHIALQYPPHLQYGYQELELVHQIKLKLTELRGFLERQDMYHAWTNTLSPAGREFEWQRLVQVVPSLIVVDRAMEKMPGPLEVYRIDPDTPTGLPGVVDLPGPFSAHASLLERNVNVLFNATATDPKGSVQTDWRPEATHWAVDQAMGGVRDMLDAWIHDITMVKIQVKKRAKMSFAEYAMQVSIDNSHGQDAHGQTGPSIREAANSFTFANAGRPAFTTPPRVPTNLNGGVHKNDLGNSGYLANEFVSMGSHQSVNANQESDNILLRSGNVGNVVPGPSYVSRPVPSNMANDHADGGDANPANSYQIARGPPVYLGSRRSDGHGQRFGPGPPRYMGYVSRRN